MMTATTPQAIDLLTSLTADLARGPLADPPDENYLTPFEKIASVFELIQDGSAADPSRASVLYLKRLGAPRELVCGDTRSR